MKFNIFLLLCSLLSVKAFAGVDFETNAHWSITRSVSPLDSLKNQVRKSPFSSSEIFKKYLSTLEFREYFKGLNSLPSTFPISSGIYNGTLQVDSLSAFDQHLFLLRNLGDLKSEADLLSRYGVYFALQGENQKGVSLLQQSLILHQKINDQPAVLRNTLYLAKILHFQGDFEAALTYNNQVVSLSQDGRSNKFLAESYLNVSEIMIAKGEFQGAEQLIMKKTLPLVYYKLKDKEATMQCFEQLASLYQSQKRFSEAKWFFIQSNMVARASRNIPGIVRTLSKLAHVKMAIGDTELAIRDYKEAEQLSKANNYQNKLVEIKSDLSEAYLKLGHVKEADLAKSEYIALQEVLLKKI